MITYQQMQATRTILGLDQCQPAELAGLSLPTIQRMGSSDGQVRGVVDTLMKVITIVEGAGIERLCENATSTGVGRGVRLCETANSKTSERRQSLIYGKVPAERAEK